MDAVPVVGTEEASLSCPCMVRIIPERSVEIAFQEAGNDLVSLSVRRVPLMDSPVGRSNKPMLLPVGKRGRIPVAHIMTVALHEVAVTVQISHVRYFPCTLTIIDEVLGELHWLRVAAVGPLDPIYHRVAIHCHVIVVGPNLNADAVSCAKIVESHFPCIGGCDVALGGVANCVRYFGPRVLPEL